MRKQKHLTSFKNVNPIVQFKSRLHPRPLGSPCSSGPPPVSYPRTKTHLEPRNVFF